MQNAANLGRAAPSLIKRKKDAGDECLRRITRCRGCFRSPSLTRYNILQGDIRECTANIHRDN
jgi:hypothetical protein